MVDRSIIGLHVSGILRTDGRTLARVRNSTDADERVHLFHPVDVAIGPYRKAAVGCTRRERTLDADRGHVDLRISFRLVYGLYQLLDDRLGNIHCVDQTILTRLQVYGKTDQKLGELTLSGIGHASTLLP